MFRRPTVRYGATPEPETPYQRAGQAWDDRIGSARVQARNWRLAFFGALLISGGLAAGLVWQSVRGTVTPWVVQIDKLGQAQAVAPAIADYRPTDPQIAWHLARFIEEVRSIPDDPVVLRQNWLPVLVGLLVSTVLGVVVTGFVMHWVCRAVEGNRRRHLVLAEGPFALTFGPGFFAPAFFMPRAVW